MDPDYRFGVSGLDFYCLQPLPDGRVYVGGKFNHQAPSGSPTWNNIIRVQLVGGVHQPDPWFVAQIGICREILLQPDGKIIAIGDISSVNGFPIKSIARLNTDGSLDTTFMPDRDWVIYAAALQPDGRVIMATSQETGGAFVRLLPDGRTDKTFFVPVLNRPQYTRSLATDPTGRILIPAGDLLQYSGQMRVIVPPAEVPVHLQRNFGLSSTWDTLQTIPANTPYEHIDTNFPNDQTQFFKTIPAN